MKKAPKTYLYTYKHTALSETKAFELLQTSLAYLGDKTTIICPDSISLQAIKALLKHSYTPQLSPQILTLTQFITLNYTRTLESHYWSLYYPIKHYLSHYLIL